MARFTWSFGLASCVIAWATVSLQAGNENEGIAIEKDKKRVLIDVKIAPRKLEYLKGQVYPIEVIACWPHPKGKKAHETVVTMEATPSKVHKALEQIGLKAGEPVMGQTDKTATGPTVKVYLEVPDEAGGTKKITLDKALLDSRNGKAFPKDVEWRFTGSAMVQPDPAKNDKVYGADFSGTLLVIFPVTNQTVFQSNLSMKYEGLMKLEVNSKALPKEGTLVKLVIEATAK